MSTLHTILYTEFENYIFFKLFPQLPGANELIMPSNDNESNFIAMNYTAIVTDDIQAKLVELDINSTPYISILYNAQFFYK